MPRARDGTSAAPRCSGARTSDGPDFLADCAMDNVTHTLIGSWRDGAAYARKRIRRGWTRVARRNRCTPRSVATIGRALMRGRRIRALCARTVDQRTQWRPAGGRSAIRPRTGARFRRDRPRRFAAMSRVRAAMDPAAKRPAAVIIHYGSDPISARLAGLEISRRDSARHRARSNRSHASLVR